MTEISRKLEPAYFDAVLCLGNTLVHLPNPKDIARLLKDMAEILKPDGLLVLQILNYDRIPTGPPYSLPVLETEALRFERQYHFEGSTMQFVTTLNEKQTGLVIRNSIPLYPLRRHELDSMLDDAGFQKITHYGSYLGDPLTDSSFPLVVLATN